MDKDTRSILQRATQAARRTLEEEFGAQLEGVFDIRPDGTVAPEAGRHLVEDGEAQRVRVKLVAAVQHHREQGRRPVDAVAAVLRECAFTTLNRFVALKMLEAREIVKPCVSQGPLSGGFKEFTGLAPGLATLPDQGYRLYLDSLFDEIGREVKVLFDRRDPASLLWPRKPALDALLGILNDAALAGVWGEDETIGWVYQYFNGKEEREAMRDLKRGGSESPRNSRELAVRNQFFTPRYVVEFLTDNTLGRTWVEMRQGDTRLVETCRYLVTRPSEGFVPKGEGNQAIDDVSPPASRPLYVPFRAKNDPRDLRVLDPACGSGHFLLYSFDLLLLAYEEAWADVDSPASEATGRPLAVDYPALETLRRALPALVLRHNLFGVDIDPRAAQIAALALWMRAQRAWNDLGFKRADRPLVTRTNIVVAEPMPGELDLLDGLCDGLDKPVADIVRTVFDDMKLAGEAGVLLRIEETLSRGVERLARLGGIFATADARRWERLEERIYGVMREYAESVGGRGYRRRLFADDAAHGFAFIDLCRQSYDVILMNPPFGEPTPATKDLLQATVPGKVTNLYAGFVVRALQMLRGGGTCGCISSRTFLKYRDYEKFRLHLLEAADLGATADLGWGVLDSAQVETVAFTMAKTARRVDELIGPFFRLLGTNLSLKDSSLLKMVASPAGAGVFFCRPELFRALPGTPFCYWTSASFVGEVAASEPLHPSRAYIGLGASPHAHFFRVWWECASSRLGTKWRAISRGGDYSPFFRDNSLMIDWARDGRAVKAHILYKYPYLDGNYGWKIQDEGWYGRAGLTWGKRNERFNMQAMPAGHIFTDEGQGLIVLDPEDVFLLLGYLNSSFIGYFLDLTSGLQKHYVYLRPIPILRRIDEVRGEIEDATRAVLNIKLRWAVCADPGRYWSGPSCLDWRRGETIDSHAARIRVEWDADAADLARQRARVDDAVVSITGLGESDIEEMTALRREHPSDVPSSEWTVARLSEPAGLAAQLISWAVGVAFGRFRCNVDASAMPLTSEEVLAEAPRLPSGMVGDDAGPSPTGLRIEHRSGFPVDGILVDDPGADRDVLAALRIAFAAGFGSAGDERLTEVVALLDPRANDLRPWLRGTFFAEHIQRYSKSRRKAPIYWRLGTPSGSYSVWLYLHRASPDTLHAVLRDYVEPKLRYEEERWRGLAAEAGPTPSTSQRKELAAQEAFVDELRAFRDELLRVAPLWHPDLDDGVVINASFLHRLFLHTRTWAKECEGQWEKLKAGEYDWAHLAMRLWPERVVPKSAEDRSLAIAHGLEDVFWVEGDDGKWSPRDVDEATIQRVVAERTSAAVKAALREVSAAPPPSRVARAPRPAPVAAKPRERGPKESVAQLPLDLGGPRPRADKPALDALRAALHGFPDGAGRSELLAASGLDEAQWMPAITELVESGEVERTGQKRGTRYTLHAGGTQ